MNNRQETTYNEIIGIAGGEIVVLTDTFEYKDGLKGATGFTIEPLTKDQIEAMKDPVELREIWQEVVSSGNTDEGLTEWAEKVNEENTGTRQYGYMDDPSFREDMDKAYGKLSDEDRAKIVQEFGEFGKDFEDWNSRSCGRCIPTKESDYSLLLRPDLLKVVQEFENAK